MGSVGEALPRFAVGLSSSIDTLQASLIAAIEKPLPHRMVSSAPCQEEIIAEPSLADELPIPRFFEKEAGPYITAGAIVARDRLGASGVARDRLRAKGPSKSLRLRRPERKARAPL